MFVSSLATVNYVLFGCFFDTALSIRSAALVCFADFLAVVRISPVQKLNAKKS
jgi:hypothetical protein